MKIALGLKAKLEFVDGKISKPAETDALFSLWNRCNLMHQITTKLGVNSASNLSRIAYNIPNQSHVSSFSTRVHLPPGDSLSSGAHIPAVDSLSSRIHVPTVDSLSSRIHVADMDSLSRRIDVPAVDSLANRLLLSDADPLIGRAKLPAMDSLIDTNLSKYDIYTSIADKYLTPYSSSVSAPSLSNRLGTGRMGESSPTSFHQTPLSPSSYSKIGLFSSSVTDVPHHQPMRPQIRFDPYTREPYKFDPFTGEPIVHESLSRHSPNPF